MCRLEKIETNQSRTRSEENVVSESICVQEKGKDPQTQEMLLEDFTNGLQK